MDKNDFKPDTRYTIAWKNPSGRVQPANIYVYRAYDKFLVARMTMGAGALRRIGYDEIVHIAKAMSAEGDKRLNVPAALLEEKAWQDRVEMAHYASSPGLGK